MSISFKRLIFAGLLLCVSNLYSAELIFCAESYNLCRLPRTEGSSEWQNGELPKGSRFFPEASTFLWNPENSQIGIHKISFSRVHKGQRETTNITVRVKKLEKALFVLAHQDDELCIIGKIKQLADAGKDISLLWTRSSSKVRIEEATKAMAQVVLRRDNMYFWNHGSLSDPSAFRVYIDRFADLIAENNYDQIYVVAYEGGHIEHDLTHIAAVTACRERGFSGQIYEFGLYHLEKLIPRPFALLPAPSPTIQMHLGNKDVNFIKSLADIYVSQKQVTLGFELVMSEKKKAHPCFRPLPEWDYMRPPAKGALWYEVNLKHPASFNNHILPALNVNLKTNPAFINRKIPYAQDELKSEFGKLSLPDQRGEDVELVRFPYSVYAYSGLLVFASAVAIGVGTAAKRRSVIAVSCVDNNDMPT